MRNLDQEFDLYARLVLLGENLLPLSPLSELARCYEVQSENGNKTNQETNEDDDQA